MPMSKDEQARKGKELLAEAVPYLLQSDHDEEEILDLVQDLISDWEEGQRESDEIDPPSPWREAPVRSSLSD